MAESLEGLSPRPIGALAPLSQTAPSRRDGDGQADHVREARGLSGLGDYGAHGREEKTAQTAGDRLELSPEAQQQLRRLKERDAEVRAHEQAHMAAGGAHVVGGPTYTYQQGPDGRQYAIGGEVAIDTSEVPGDPEATQEKARQVRRAALAPASPSGADRQIAAKASAQEAEAQREERQEDSEKADEARGVEGVDAQPAAQAGQTPLEVALARRREELAMRRAATAYADMAMMGIMPTALAPAGTGLYMQI